MAAAATAKENNMSIVNPYSGGTTCTKTGGNNTGNNNNTFGLAGTTLASKDSGLKKFNEFRASLGKSDIERMTEQDIEGDFLEELLYDFARYLVTQNLKPGSMKQYLSNAQRRLQERFKNHDAWKGEMGWYTTLRTRLESHAERMEMGKPPDASQFNKCLPFYIALQSECIRVGDRATVADSGTSGNGAPSYATDGKTLCSKLVGQLIDNAQTHPNDDNMCCPL